MCVCVCVCVCVCIPILVTMFPEKALRNNCRTHPAPCVCPRCVYSVFRAHAQYCRFDKVDATADAINDRRSDTTILLGADTLVYWIRKIVRTCAPSGSRVLDFLHASRAPYPLCQALRFPNEKNRHVHCQRKIQV